MAISFKGTHFPPAVMLMGVRWYSAYPLSTGPRTPVLRIFFWDFSQAACIV